MVVGGNGSWKTLRCILTSGSGQIWSLLLLCCRVVVSLLLVGSGVRADPRLIDLEVRKDLAFFFSAGLAEVLLIWMPLWLILDIGCLFYLRSPCLDSRVGFCTTFSSARRLRVAAWMAGLERDEGSSTPFV